MTPQAFHVFHLTAEHNGLKLAAVLKRLCAERSWSQVRKLISGRRVEVNGNLCLDEERSLKGGDVIKVWEQARAAPVREDDVRLAYVDEHLIVVEKPAGVTTLRHREESDLPQRRKQLQPTLDELVKRQLARQLGIREPEVRDSKRRRTRPDRRLEVRAVHRLDRDTSGLIVFARTPEAEQKLVRMFAKHEVQRAYVAVVYGHVEAQTIDTWIVRDRGDGLRGSAARSEEAEGAQRAITHVRPMEQLAEYTIVECRLETGRTHQIRIHLSESGHLLCGERVYTHPVGGKPLEDTSDAPRQALHAAELAFLHPFTGKAMRFRMPLPRDLKEWVLGLRKPMS